MRKSYDTERSEREGRKSSFRHMKKLKREMSTIMVHKKGRRGEEKRRPSYEKK
jgi:hypothetical protein